MAQELLDAFCWHGTQGQARGELTEAQRYQELAVWAGSARGRNPLAFDALTGWMQDDAAWRDDQLADNQRILMQGVIARFKEQNARLRALLLALEPSGVVNAAVFKALDRFDDELSGSPYDPGLRDAVARMFADFSVMRDDGVRALIAGNKTGQFGTKGVDFVGYINYLMDCDAGVQWALFMPGLVARQQRGFKVESFAYQTMPAMRFIGQECGGALDEQAARAALFRALDALAGYRSGMDADVLFMHHYGKAVDVERWHGFWGRFMKADAPVPEGFLSFDLVPKKTPEAGPPYCSRFALAVFSGDMTAMHKREGFDSDAMYDVTRNIILGQGVVIPYPETYWTAEVFLDGWDKVSTAFLFSVVL